MYAYDIIFQIGFTALMYATQRGHLEMATLLVDSGADIEAKNNVSESMIVCVEK